MTIQELINELQKIGDKSLKVHVANAYEPGCDTTDFEVKYDQYYNVIELDAIIHDE